ncbi:sensor histidine kinase [Dyella sp.]|uniref:sensor histidine kinase n=1 Tax=Dyella sp. TaxID=1869338 RepID=UPI002ED078C5
MPSFDRTNADYAPLPDFCSMPVVFALLVIGALTATVVWIASSNQGWAGYSVCVLFIEWMMLLLGVTLCKLRPWLQRLHGYLPYVGAWAWIVLLVAPAAALCRWLGESLQLETLRGSRGSFVLASVLIAALLGAAVLRYFYVLAQWQARLAAVSRAQVDALQARIRPHFLFNSMNTVAALVRVDPAAAERTVEDLSELFRAALGQHQSRDGTVEDELTLIDRYLAIEQLRLGDRLRIRRELALPLDYPMPRLLLQPLVENAVRHGIQPSREGGELILRGIVHDRMLVIEIDNPLAATPSEPGTGHGLENVRQRVAYRYGDRARVDAGPHDGRFLVRLQLPETP